jgi:hypothetical protein
VCGVDGWVCMCVKDRDRQAERERVEGRREGGGGVAGD